MSVRALGLLPQPLLAHTPSMLDSVFFFFGPVGKNIFISPSLSVCGLLSLLVHPCSIGGPCTNARNFFLQRVVRTFYRALHKRLKLFFAGCCSHILPLRAQRKTFRKWRSHSTFLFLTSFPSLWSALPSSCEGCKNQCEPPVLKTCFGGPRLRETLEITCA